MSAWVFAVALVPVGVAAAVCVVLAGRTARWRRAALGGAVLLSFAVMEASAIYLDVHDVLEP